MGKHRLLISIIAVILLIPQEVSALRPMAAGGASTAGNVQTSLADNGESRIKALREQLYQMHWNRNDWDGSPEGMPNAANLLIQEGARAVPHLINDLQHKEIHVRWWAAEVLGRIGYPDAVPAIERLEHVAENDPIEEVRHRAAWAAKWIRVSRENLELNGSPSILGQDLVDGIVKRGEWALTEELSDMGGSQKAIQTAA